MNRFVLHEDPKTAAKHHCDKHVVKMIIEEAQMLSTVHRMYGYEGDELYKATHAKHPCTVWASESRENYEWAYSLLTELCGEYTLRYNKIHKTSRLLELLWSVPAGIPDVPMTPIPQAMPDDVKIDGEPIKAYRNYYIVHKSRFAVWRYTEAPDWWPVEVR